MIKGSVCARASVTPVLAPVDTGSPVLMVDPAVGYAPGEDYGAYDRGTTADIWLKAANGSSPFLGAVWPGVTVYPDWFNEKTQE